MARTKKSRHAPPCTLSDGPSIERALMVMVDLAPTRESAPLRSEYGPYSSSSYA